jgi:hypothetical protein
MSSVRRSSAASSTASSTAGSSRTRTVREAYATRRAESQSGAGDRERDDPIRDAAVKEPARERGRERGRDKDKDVEKDKDKDEAVSLPSRRVSAKSKPAQTQQVSHFLPYTPT